MSARRRTKASWAKAIRSQWQQSVECIIEVGRLLEQSKTTLPHGQFEQMVEEDLPFGARAARMLMTIARHPTLTKRKHASVLPASWYTLYEMTRLPERDLGVALASGELGPETKRRDVVQLKETLRQQELRKTRGRRKRCTVADLDELVDAGKHFGCIYGDPPWPYDRNYANKMGSAHKFYSSMSLDEIKELPVSQLAAKSAQLHLWTTGSFLFEARDVLEAWGFEYKSSFVWVKPGVLGAGYYWRGSHEILLLGVRGSCPFRDRSHRSWVELPRSIHSAKPPHVRKLIESVSPGPRLELFARATAPGWTTWGNEISRAEFRKAAAS